MKNYEILYRDLIFLLRKRIPKKSKLVAKLVEILPLEKEAVYRRLRQEVPFTFEEVVIISKEFNISLDCMIGIDAKTTLPFRFQAIDNENPVKIDYLIFEDYLHAINGVASDSNGIILSVTNILPQLFYTGFKYLYYFYYFKWQYYSIPAHQTKSYHEIIFPDKLTNLIEDIFNVSKKVRNNYFILDNQIFQNIINDVLFFNSIRLIRDEDIQVIKNELFRFLDYMEVVATKGFADNPANKVFIYISETNIETSYSCIDSKSSYQFSMLWSFIFNCILNFNKETIEITKRRIQSIIRTSTLLSVTGEKQRLLYFEKQRKIVDQL